LNPSHVAAATAARVVQPGAGLGLTIAKMLTDLMGGELTVTQCARCGRRVQGQTVFARGAGGHQRHGVLARLQSIENRLFVRRPRLSYAGPRRRILVVDNEEADRELLVHVLQPIGFELRLAASGHDCLDLLAAGYQPQAILMDLAMPGIDGWETIRRLRVLH
jgi:hypothetical protein